MTPIRPRHSSKVKPASVTAYTLNEICAHPECDKPVDSAHHIFGRFPGEIGGSWYVEIEDEGIVPHVTGLCGSGTKEHHGELEGHYAKIELEDGVYVWYDRPWGKGFDSTVTPIDEQWELVGPLDPQPGETKKKKKSKKKDKDRRERKIISFSRPKDAKDEWAGIIDDALEEFERLWSEGSKLPPRGRGYTIEDAVLCGFLYILDNPKKPEK